MYQKHHHFIMNASVLCPGFCCCDKLSKERLNNFRECLFAASRSCSDIITHDMSVHVSGSCLHASSFLRLYQKKRWYSHLNVVFIIFYCEHRLRCHGVLKKRPYINQQPRRIHVLCGCVACRKLFSWYCLWHEYFYYILSSWYWDEDDDVEFIFLLLFSIGEPHWLLSILVRPIRGHYLMTLPRIDGDHPHRLSQMRINISSTMPS